MTILKMDDFIVRDRNLFKCFDEWHRIVLTFKKNFCFLFCDFFSPLMQHDFSRFVARRNEEHMYTNQCY